MDIKKDFFHRNIKQETENEPYGAVETFPNINNLLKVKFEDPAYVNCEVEDQINCTIENIIYTNRPNQLKECKSTPVAQIVSENLLEAPQQMCRLCAEPITNTKVYLYDGNGREQKVNYSLPITAGLGDGLPEYICPTCDANLNSLYNFICRVVDADKILRRLNLADVKTGDVASSTHDDIGSTEVIHVDDDSHGHLLSEPGCEQFCNDIKTQDNETLKVISKKPTKRLHEEEDFVIPQKLKAANQDIPVVQNQVESDKGFKCQQCVQNFTSYTFLIDHIQQSHKTACHPCPEIGCLEMFTTTKSMCQHISDNHSVPVICYKCGKIFLHKEALRKHHQNMHFHKVCKDCGMAFKSAISFETHASLHTNVREHQCVYCFKCFGNRGTLHRHTRQCHSGSFTLLVDTNEDGNVHK